MPEHVWARPDAMCLGKAQHNVPVKAKHNVYCCMSLYWYYPLYLSFSTWFDRMPVVGVYELHAARRTATMLVAAGNLCFCAGRAVHILYLAGTHMVASLVILLRPRLYVSISCTQSARY
eukprot:366139-Chlamydomonas_euryale.AAC.7